MKAHNCQCEYRPTKSQSTNLIIGKPNAILLWSTVLGDVVVSIVCVVLSFTTGITYLHYSL
ncbi:MAG: hypothetical protein AAGB12_09825 [Pseudomonadota bacterium]